MSEQRLFLVNGDAAAGALEAAGLVQPAEVLVLHDVLSCGLLAGPTPPADLADWVTVRETFWSRVWDSAMAFGAVDEPLTGFMNKPRNVYAGGARLQVAEEIVLCTGAGLSDVLAQGFFLAWAGALGIERERLHQIAWANAEATPVGLPHLAPQALAAACRIRPMAPDRQRGALSFWRSFAAAQPQGAPPPDRAGEAQLAALAAWRQRFPTGARALAAWDEQLLCVVANGEATVRSVLAAALRRARAAHDPVGDLVLMLRLHQLAAAEPGPALLRLGAPRDLETLCLITDAGRRALAGQQDDATRERRAAWCRSLA